MTPRRVSLVFGLLLLALTLDAAPRRRAAGFPSAGPLDATPGDWLAANAHVLRTTELSPDRSDLFPLRSMIGSAEVVGLGDITHGTHEVYTIKLRVVDYLVREMGFDVLGWEAPFPLVESINTYVQTGAGDPRALLGQMYTLTYFFWDADEILAVIEWMREYNVHRGDRPPVTIVGFDVTQPNLASAAVIEYLRAVDPPAAVFAEDKYRCASSAPLSIPDGFCVDLVGEVLASLVAREAELTALSSAHDYNEALHNARIIGQSRVLIGPPRDLNMANNVLWLRQHRGSARKMILWAHSAHLSQSRQTFLEEPMGITLAASLEDDYFSLTTMTAAGSYLQWQDPTHTRTYVPVTRTFAALPPASYETSIRQRGEPYLLIPFRKVLPQWLAGSRSYNLAGASGPVGSEGVLATQFDAAIFVDTTTAMHPLVH